MQDFFRFYTIPMRYERKVVGSLDFLQGCLLSLVLCMSRDMKD